MKLVNILSILLLLITQQLQALCLKTDKLEYTLGEPVVLYVSLQNTENIPIELPRFLQPEYDEVEYKINGKRFIPWIVMDIAVSPTKTFVPGEIIREEVNFLFNGNEWLFPKAGIYTITATLYGQSSSITIAVQSPNTNDKELEKASQLLLGSYEAGYFLSFEGEGAQFLTEGIQILKKIANDYPISTLATYANYTLGHSQAFLGNYQEALPYLKVAQQNPVGFYDIVHTHMSLYQSYMGLENIQKAETVLEELKEKISKQFNDFKPFINAIFSENNLPYLFEPWSTPQIEEAISCQKSCPQEAFYNATTRELLIPCIKALDDSGNIIVYEVVLNQKTPSFVFDLDVNSIKPHE